MQAPVFALLGHACDLTKSDGQIEELPVPEGCVYVTLAKCGFVSYELYKLMYAFSDPTIHYALSDPVKYIKELKEYFESDTITIHHPEATNEHLRTYVNSTNTLFYNHQSSNKVSKSGIYLLSNPFSMMKSTLGNPEFYLNVPHGHITKEQIYAIYEGALFPKADDIITRFLSREKHSESMDILSEKIAMTYDVTQKELFRQNKGIYYNFACRPLCNGTDLMNSRVKLRRAKSGHANSNNTRNDRSKAHKLLVEWVNKQHAKAIQRLHVFKPMSNVVLANYESNTAKSRTRSRSRSRSRRIK